MSRTKDARQLHSLLHTKLGCNGLLHVSVFQMLPPGTSQAPPLYPVLETRFSSLTLLILSLLLSRNCGSSHAPTSFTGSVLTPGCSNTTRVHFACSIFLVGISQPGIGVGAGIVPRRNTYLWAMHAVSAAQEYVCVGGGGTR